MTPEKYSSLKAQKVFSVEYHKAIGWDFSELDELTENQAKRFLELLYQLQKFEDDNNIRKPVREVVFLHNKGNPEWPEELRGYDTEFLFEAYLRNKFNLENLELS